MGRYETITEAKRAVALRHGIEVDDLDIIPCPRHDGRTYISFGPADEDVEYVEIERDDE